MHVGQADRCRCLLDGCGCEITVWSHRPDEGRRKVVAREMETTQNFSDCCGDDIERVEQ